VVHSNGDVIKIKSDGEWDGRCPECKKLGLKSTVTEGWSTITCMAPASWYDENGVYHYDDPNITTKEYSCSRGHGWVEKTRQGKVIEDEPSSDSINITDDVIKIHKGDASKFKELEYER
jgi:hypothetical protein